MAARHWIATLLLGGGLGFGASPVGAAVSAGYTERELATEFQVPESRIRRLLEKEGMSLEEARISMILARETGRSLDDIAGLRRAGVSFDDIAARHRLDLDEILDDYDRRRAKDRRAEPTERRREAVRSEAEQERIDRIARRHGVPASQVGELRREGHDWRTIERMLRTSAAPEDSEVEERPLWDSPSNPFVEEEWNEQHDWTFYRDREPNFPKEQLEDRKERPSR